MKKINSYVFIQIFKSCTLIFFIFLSISWLTQLSRLFSMFNNLQIEIINIIFLSIYLIPNLINVTLPFIIIFGIILAFIKLDKDKEIIAIYSLGISIKQIEIPIKIFIYLIIIFYALLNFYISPIVYDKFKNKEYEIRNKINLNKINIANFIEIGKDTILEFDKENDSFIDIFINYKDDEGVNNIIYAEKGEINSINNLFIFDLFEGFKLSIVNDNIEKLEFENYKIDFPVFQNQRYDNIDKNSITINTLIKNKSYLIISEKIIDILIVILSIILFYILIIKKNNYQLKRILIYLILSIVLVVAHNVIKNINISSSYTLALYLINILWMMSLIFATNEKNK